MSRLAIAMWLALVSGGAYGQVVESAPKSVVVYENGVAWVVEEAVGGAPGNTLSTRIHGAPLDGGVWVSTGGQVDVLSVRVPSLPSPEAGLAELLRSADAPTVYVVGRGKTTRGRLLGVTALAPRGPQVLVLETAEGQVALPLELVESVELEGKPLSADILRGMGTRRIDVRFSKSAAPILSLGYFTTGLGWVPEYRVLVPEKSEKGDKATVELEAWALVSNDAMDLKGVKATLLSGKPPFAVSATPSPLVRPFVYVKKALAGGGGSGASVGSGSSGSLAETMAPFGGLEANLWVAGEEPGAGTEPAVTQGPLELSLERGQRGMLPLGRGTGKGRVVYLAEAAGAHSGPGDSQFYETLVFQNSLTFPLVPGRVLALKGSLAVGQGTVGLTAPQAEARVRLTSAPFLSLDVRETSVEKDGDSVKGPDGAEYQPLVVKGTIRVASTQKGKTSVWVDLPVAGDVKSTSDDAVVEEKPTVEGSMNSLSRVRWQIEVEQGNAITLEYEFTTFIKSGYGKSSL